MRPGGQLNCPGSRQLRTARINRDFRKIKLGSYFIRHRQYKIQGKENTGQQYGMQFHHLISLKVAILDPK
jgi:hypothetical protein